MKNARSGEFDYKWKSYDQVDADVHLVAQYIKKYSFAQSVLDTCCNKTIQTVGICSVNREEWLVTDLACNLLGITSVPLYETLGDEILKIILDQTEMTTLFGTDVALKGILKLMGKDKLTFLK